jgi:hypothetical protein
MRFVAQPQGLSEGEGALVDGPGCCGDLSLIVPLKGVIRELCSSISASGTG